MGLSILFSREILTHPNRVHHVLCQVRESNRQNKNTKSFEFHQSIALSLDALIGCKSLRHTRCAADGILQWCAKISFWGDCSLH